MTNKELFMQRFEPVKRKGLPELLEWLDSTEFFTQPASSRFHGAYAGGLLDHSLAVYDAIGWQAKAFKKLKENVDLPPDSLTIVSLLHDVCKHDAYEETTRNMKDKETGQWKSVPYFALRHDGLPIPHGDKSVVEILNAGLELTMEEIVAIRSHMGAWNVSGYEETNVVSRALDEYPLALCLHIADMMSSHLVEK
jgi:hypothetical protein